MKLIIIFLLGSENDSSDTDLGEAEIEDMLNEALPEDLRNKKIQSQYDEKYKTVLEGLLKFIITIKLFFIYHFCLFLEKGQNHFEVLPEGWVQATHNSGMPLYLHTSTRVCTVARPYFLGPGSVRVGGVPRIKLIRPFN